MILNIILMLSFCIIIISSKLSVEITPGAYVQRLPDVSFYQSTIPILFQYKKPLSLLELLNCTNFCNTANGVCEIISNMSDYYLSLVECALSNKGLSLIGIHVPMIHKRLKGLSMKKLVTPNFAWENFTCKVDIPAFDLAMVELDSKWTILLPKCDPFKDELCLVTNNYDNDALGVACVKQLLTGGSVKQLSNVCPLSCKDTGRGTQFLVPLGLRKYLVTHPNPQLQIHCPNEQHGLNATIGSLIVTLPCDCNLKDYTGIEVKPTYACQLGFNDKLRIQLSIPAAWVKLEGLTIPPFGENSPTFANLDACLDTKWLKIQQEIAIQGPTSYILIGVIMSIQILFFCLGYFLYKSIQEKFLNYVPLITIPRRPSVPQDPPRRPTSLCLNNPPRIHFPMEREILPELPPRNNSKNSTPENAYLEPTQVQTTLKSSDLESTRGYIPLSQLMQQQSEGNNSRSPPVTPLLKQMAEYSEYVPITRFMDRNL